MRETLILPALLLTAAFGLSPSQASARTSQDDVRTASDKAHADLDREAAKFEDSEKPAPTPEPAVEPKPAPSPQAKTPKAAPEIKAAPTPEPAPRPEPKVEPATPVTLYWHMADDADLYLNGKPLREYAPSFKTRGDEAPLPAFSTAAALRDGDVFTVCGRRGGSYGFMLIAADSADRVVFMSDDKGWKAYAPGERADWFAPKTAQACESRAVTVQPDPWYPQKELNAKYGNQALSIWDKPSERFACLYAVVALRRAAPETK